MCDKPVATFRGWMPNGVNTTIPVPLDGTPEDFDRILNYQNMFLSRGFVLADPAYGKLEAGEKTDTVGYVVRYDKENKRGGISHWIGLYPDSDEATKKYLWVYLDTPEDITDFEAATGVKVASMEVWPTNQAPERSPSTMKFIVKVKPGTTVVYKINPEWSDDPKDKFVPKRIFVRWATPPVTPQPPQPPAATQPTAAGKPAPEPQVDYAALELEERKKAVTALDNEAVTIFKSKYNPLHGGNGNPRWEAMARIADGASVPVVLWTEHVNLVKKAGYDWPQYSDDLAIPVITELVGSERRIKSVEAIDGTWMPLPDRNANLPPPSAENGQPAIEPAWYATQAKDCWGVIKGWLLNNMYAKNAYHMNASFHKHGITVDSKGQQLTPEWADSCAGDLIKYLEQHRELAEAS